MKGFSLPQFGIESVFAVKNRSSEIFFRLQVLVARDVAMRFRKKAKIILAGSLNLCHAVPRQMNQHSPDKEPLSLQIPRTLKVRLSKEAKHQGLKVSELVVRILAAETADIPLTSRDYEAIRIATEKAEKTGRRLATVIDDAA